MAFQKWDHLGTWSAELQAVDDEIDERMPVIELVLEFRARGYYRDGDSTGPPELSEERIPDGAYLVVSDATKQILPARLRLPQEWCTVLAEYFFEEITSVELTTRH